MIGHLRLDNAQKKLRERSLVVQHPELFRNKVQEGAKNVAECSLRCDLPDWHQFVSTAFIFWQIECSFIFSNLAGISDDYQLFLSTSGCSYRHPVADIIQLVYDKGQLVPFSQIGYQFVQFNVLILGLIRIWGLHWHWTQKRSAADSLILCKSMFWS